MAEIQRDRLGKTGTALEDRVVALRPETMVRLARRVCTSAAGGMNMLLALLAFAAIRGGAAARATPRLTLADAPDALKVAEAAALLGISEGLCRREIAAGRIPAVWFGRIVRVPKVAVERLLEGEQ